MFVEHNTTVFSTNNTTEMQNFLKNTLHLIQDEDNKDIFWCDNSKTIGIKCYTTAGTSYTNLALAACYKSNGAILQYNLSGIITSNTSSSGKSVYWQMSKDKDVIYMRGNPQSDTAATRLLLANDSSGEWAVLADSYIYHKSGRTFIEAAHDNHSASTPFSAAQMPNLASAAGGKFTNLYKILTATTFALSGTYVNFDGEPYRVVSARSGTATATVYADYAFPVADE